MEAFQRSVADLAPRWHKPGLLLIGDAAHTMSPVGGVGINYAIQDAVVTANMVTIPLLHGTLTEQHLQAVQRRRELPTRIIQRLQTIAQKQVVARALASLEELRPPLLMRVLLRPPFIRDVPPRLIGLGLWSVHVNT